MRVLVTGGSGFIGSNLALELERRGNDVVVADRNLSTAEVTLSGFRGRRIQVDVSEPHAFEGHFDAIFHQAAVTDPRHDDDKETYGKNVEGHRRMLQLAEENGAALIYASTAGLYGNGSVPMQEDQRKDCLTAYGRSKLAMDEMLDEWRARLPRLVGLRYFNVYGPREAHKGRPSSMVLQLSRQLLATGVARLFEHGEQIRDFVYVKDAVAANLLALDAPSGVYNVGTGVGTTFNELVAALGRALNLSPRVEYFPMPYDPATYQSNTQADTARAREALGFAAEWDLDAGIADYLAWLRGNN